MMKSLKCPSDLKPFTSYKKQDGTYYVIIDMTHIWKKGLPTDQVESLVIMNVSTEEKKKVTAEEFFQWVNAGIIRPLK